MCKSNYFSIAAAALLSLTSCQALIKEDRINCTAPVTVRVQDFGISMEEFPGTKATSAVASYEGVKEITLAFDSGTTEAYKVTHRRGSLEEGETFGVFNCTLPMGSYTMVVLGYGIGLYLLYSTEKTTSIFPCRSGIGRQEKNRHVKPIRFRRDATYASKHRRLPCCLSTE